MNLLLKNGENTQYEKNFQCERCGRTFSFTTVGTSTAVSVAGSRSGSEIHLLVYSDHGWESTLT
jgi:transcription elongation factor Elf1